MPEAHVKPCYMLEHPKAQGASQATILEDEEKSEMDNQQVTQYEIGWMAGFIDGEGYIGISMNGNHKTNSTKTVKVELNVCNTDESMIQKYVEIANRLGVNPYVSEKNYRGCKKNVFRATVHRMAPLKRMLDVIMPHLTGQKRIRAELINRFLDLRMRKSAQMPGVAIPYSKEEIDIIHSCLKLQKRGTSEAIRKAEVAAHQLASGETIEKRCETARKILKLHTEGKCNRQIAIDLGYHANSGAKVGWWIKRLKSNAAPIQKLGYFPLYSDDMVRPSAKA